MRYVMLVAGSLSVLLLYSGLQAWFISKSIIPEPLLAVYEGNIASATWRLFAIGVVYIAIITMAAVFLSHRSVGPLGRLEREIQLISSSPDKLSELKVRQGDELEDLVKAINHLHSRK